MSFFQTQPDRTFSFKQIFHGTQVDHPSSQNVGDRCDGGNWHGTTSCQRLESGLHVEYQGQVQEGTFIRKANGKNTFLPEDGGTPVFVSERNSMAALNGDQGEFSSWHVVRII